MSKNKQTPKIDDFFKMITAPGIIEEQTVKPSTPTKKQTSSTKAKPASTTPNTEPYFNVRIKNNLLAALKMAFDNKLPAKEIMDTIALQYIRKRKSILLKTIDGILK